MTGGWSAYVIFLVVLNILGCAWLLFANRSAKVDKGDQGAPTRHEWDGIQELNNPLPAWWTWLFVVTIVFGIGYLVLFPGLGSFQGTLGWTSRSQWQGEMDQAQEQYGPIFDGYFAQSLPDLLSEPQALEMGGRLFAQNCATCHGSDGRGGKGYPNLTDDDWLWGGAPDTIVQTITYGRMGVMPGLGAAIGGEPGVKEMAQYVLSLSGREHDAAMAAAAEPKFAMLCGICHGAQGKGNPAMGAPNLTDDIWLHRGRLEDIEYQITNGRNNQMPAHEQLLDEKKIHLVAAYVYSLSMGPGG